MVMPEILVVNPDQSLGALLADILGEEGYRVRVAGYLEDAERMVSKDRVQLIITEAFGQVDHFQFDPAFLKRLKRPSRRHVVPIVLFSTLASSDTLRPGDFGLADVLPCSFDLSLFIDKVNRLARGATRRAGRA